MKAAFFVAACFVPLSIGEAHAQASSSAPDPVIPAARSGVTAVPPVSQAQPEAGIADIVVTAQRREERLQNVPIAVTALAGSKLSSSGVATTQDLAILTPGLSAPQVAGFTQPHIRGVGSSTNGPGLEQPVATYIDGVYIAAAPSALMTLDNVERVEVLKGPQGTLFGRNATGGLIQVVTKDPAQTPGGAFNVTYANYKDVVADGYVAGGLAEGLAADVAMRYEHQGNGWGTNLGTGNPVGDLPHDFAVRAKLVFEPSSLTKLRLAFDFEDRVSRRDSQHLGDQYKGTFDIPFFGGPYPHGGPYDNNNNFDPTNSMKGGGVSLQVNQDLRTIALQSITAYRRSHYLFELDLDQTPRDLVSLHGNTDDRQFSQELQISPINSGRLKWVAGIYYFWADDRYDPLNITFGQSPPSPMAAVPFVNSTSDRERTNAIAGYGQATYEILNNTNLTLGARYNYESKKLDGTTTLIGANQVLATTPIPNTPVNGIPASVDFKNFSYRIAVDHKFGQDILGYISYNTGFKSGGYNLAVPTNQPYRPEKIGALEAGLKTEMINRHLRMNISVYRYNYSQIQVGRYINNNESIYNGAKARVYGADLDSELIIARGLSLTAGLAYNHAQFTSFPLADIIVPGTNIVNAGPADGKRLPFAPRTTINLGGDYQFDLGFGALDLNATYYRTSKFYAAPDNVAFQPAYDLVNVSLRWTDKSRHLSIAAWGKNLGKTVYATSLVEATLGEIRSIGAPRTYGVTAGFKF